MRIQISSELDREKVSSDIKNAQIVDDGDYILLPKNQKHSVYDSEGISFINLNDIDYIEAIENDVVIYSKDRKYFSMLRLYEYLDCASYLIRISKSVIVNKYRIIDIKPSVNMKFTILVEETWLDVNRTYYYDFKDEFGI